MNKKLILVLSGALLAAACGNGGGSASGAKDTVASAPSAADTKGLELIGASDCTTCHRIHEADSGSPIGPAYSMVAAKYSPAADTTVDRLVKKVISGGMGVWGTTPMTAHPMLAEADVRTMVKYILSLKK
jgi:cytochrome c